MTQLRLILRNIAGSAFRSGAIFLCAALVAGLALSATLVVRGAEERLQHSLERMGADIVVIPWGTMRTEDMQGARLLGLATKQWMPRAYMDRVAAIKGVAEVSPQLYITTLHDTPYCSQPEVYLIAFDPATDFAIKPWLEGREINMPRGTAIGGTCLRSPNAEGRIDVLGYELQLVDNLAPVGGDLDQALLVSFETANEIISATERQKGNALYLAPNSVSAVLVRVDLGADPHEVAVRILEQVSSVLPIESTNLFQTERAQMAGLLRTALFVLGVIWVLSVVFVGLIFSMAVNERRREIGVLRALGSPQTQIFATLVAESAILALGGGTLGAALTIALVSGTGDAGFAAAGLPHISQWGLPLSVPPLAQLLGLAIAGLLASLISIVLAALVPALRISRQEVALVMRE